MNNEPEINEERVEKAIRFIEANFKSHPSLERIAQEVYLSPGHFQRIFLDRVGITPKKFLQFLSLDYLRNRLRETHNITEAAELVGFSCQSRVYDLFVNMEGMSPEQYKSQGLGTTIHYGYHYTMPGKIFIAVTEKGICELQFVTEYRIAEDFRKFTLKWKSAVLVHQPAYTLSFLQKILEGGNNRGKQAAKHQPPLHPRIWEALVKMTTGVTLTDNCNPVIALLSEKRHAWKAHRQLMTA